MFVPRSSAVRIDKPASAALRQNVVPVIIAAGLGALVLSGFAPTIQTPRTVAPGVGALTLSGSAPTILTPRKATPGVGALTLAGAAPSVLLPELTIPGVGTLQLTGFSPTIVAHPPAPIVQTSAGGGGGMRSFSLPRAGRRVRRPVTITAGLGCATLTGFAPSIAARQDVSAQPAPETISFTGHAPRVDALDLDEILVMLAAEEILT